MGPESPRVLTNGEQELKNAIQTYLREINRRCRELLVAQNQENISHRVYNLRNNIAEAFLERHLSERNPHDINEFLAYHFLIGSTEMSCNILGDLHPPNIRTVLGDVCKSLENGLLEPSP
jgi:hypothetical protein